VGGDGDKFLGKVAVSWLKILATNLTLTLAARILSHETAT